MPQVKRNKLRKNKLIHAMSLILPLSVSHYAVADTFVVSTPLDDGTGLSLGSLSAAILSANENPGADVIQLTTDVKITGVMKRLIDSDLTLTSDSVRRTIDGDNLFRPLFIKSGLVNINHLDFVNGSAQGGSAFNTGNGAGMGGSLFIYDGLVNLSFASFSNSKALGAEGQQTGQAGTSGGGMYGNSTRLVGGALFDDTVVSDGYGGYGNYRDNDIRFAQGGEPSAIQAIRNGGFGGGGAYSYRFSGGIGGFGGGGGSSYYGDGGNGGFGAGGGGVYYSYNVKGIPGYGADEYDSAGMGGAIFLRSGGLNLENVRFQNNHASAHNNAKGLGGAIFVLHSTNNTNLNNQGMPLSLGNVTGCSVIFDGNTASDDSNSQNDNDNLFDLADLYNVMGDCEQEIEITGNEIIIDVDTTSVDISNGTDFGGMNVGKTSQQIFGINNIGGSDLILTGDPIIEIQGAGSDSFAIEQMPENVIGPNQVQAFQLTFNPISIGLKEAAIKIPNNDSDESEFIFAIQGNGLGAEIAVSSSGIPIENGQGVPREAEGTYFGTDNSQQVYIILNEGSSQLELIGANPIRFLGLDVVNFSVISQPSVSVLQPGESTQFTVLFQPIEPGYKEVKLNIRTNDVDDGSFGFMIAGGKDVGDYVVNQTEDDGTGLIPNTLSWSILQANTLPGSQIITIDTDIKITGVMKRLIDSDVTIKSSGAIKTIDGDNRLRPLFIKSGQVIISRLNFFNGKAKGGKPSNSSVWHDGGGGAGMGGSLFIYDGHVSLNAAKFISSKASASANFVNGKSGGGMFYDGRRGDYGGGLFEETTSNCSYGGYGMYQNNDPNFGMGGGSFSSSCSFHGGFGGGGQYIYSYGVGHTVGSNGGFGGGGGGAYSYYGTSQAGKGGFGGGSSGNGRAGYGATFHGAAMGGAIFVRSGNLEMSHVQMLDNEATTRGNSKGLGGAIFVIQTLNNPNGNNQGMPTELPVVSGCNMTFQNNVAGDDLGSEFNNDDIFDLAGRYTDLGECEVEVEFDIIFESGFE